MKNISIDDIVIKFGKILSNGCLLIGKNALKKKRSIRALKENVLFQICYYIMAITI